MPRASSANSDLAGSGTRSAASAHVAGSVAGGDACSRLRCSSTAKVLDCKLRMAGQRACQTVIDRNLRQHPTPRSGQPRGLPGLLPAIDDPIIRQNIEVGDQLASCPATQVTINTQHIDVSCKSFLRHLEEDMRLTMTN